MTSTNYPSLSGARVIVTGGASGIGEFIIRAFVNQGARVGFIDRDEETGHRLANELQNNAAHPPMFMCLDLTNLDRIEAGACEMIDQLGGCDVLINNAANDERHLLSDITPAYWRDRMSVNLDHFVFMSKAVIPAMDRAGGGAILNMGSCSWRLGLGGMTAYVTAKAAIEGFTNGLARELGPKRIRVNCIIPGFIQTRRQVEKWLTPDLEKTIKDGQCLPDFIEPGDVAKLLMFLASDDGRMCSSGTYPIDAGWI